MKPIERVKKVIEFKKLSISGFEKATGMSNNSIQTALKRNSNLKDDTLNSILIRFPDISGEWLLTGEGSMLKNNLTNESDKDHINYKELAEARLDTIELLKEKVDKLNNEVVELTKNKGYGSSVKRGAVEFLNEPKLGGISGKKG